MALSLHTESARAAARASGARRRCPAHIHHSRQHLAIVASAARAAPEVEPAKAPGIGRRAALAGLLAAGTLSLPRRVLAEGGKTVFFDVTISGEPAGRITVELFPDVPAGTARFAELAAGKEGVDYRLSKFNAILPTYVRNDGVSQLSYSASKLSPIVAGDSIDQLETELDKQTRTHSEPGLVSIIVREKEARPVKERLVARDGKFITVLEQAGEAPNGTQFAITTAPSPDLDACNLIVGRVVGGSELLARISALPVNKPRNDNPYFVAGKAMGDKRAVTAERAFYRPFQKVVVSASGLL